MDPTTESDDERATVREYATQDVELLFQLADALAKQEVVA